jgi:small neutral amino acid transporter SnatA (MarC family)
MFKPIPWAALADKADQLFASFSRPYIAIICGTAVAGACFNAATAPIALPIAGGVVVAYMGARTVDKAIKANAETKQAAIDANAPQTPAT